MNSRLIDWIKQSPGPSDREAIITATELGIRIEITNWLEGGRWAMDRIISYSSIDNAARVDPIDEAIAGMIKELDNPRG